MGDTTRNREAFKNRLKNQSQFSLYNDVSHIYYHRKRNRMVECMNNKSADNLENVFNLHNKSDNESKRTLTPLDNIGCKQRSLVVCDIGKENGMRAKWDKEAERILNIVRERKAAANYNRSKINPYRNGYLKQTVALKVTEQNYNLINKWVQYKHGKEDNKKGLIHQVEEDRRQRIQKRCEYGRKSSGLITAQKNRNKVLGLKDSPGKNERRDKNIEDRRSIISDYKMKQQKINKMRKVSIIITY